MANSIDVPEVTTVVDYLSLVDADDHLRARTASVAEEVWHKLLDCGYSKVSVLLNRKLPLSVLERLSQDQDATVRSAVADKRAAAPLLPKLARDADAIVRARVACNAKVTRETLELLAEDEVPMVSETARERLSASPS